MSILEREANRFADDRRTLRRLDALRFIMQGVARVFANRRINVTLKSGKTERAVAIADAPAWTNGSDIFLNADKITASLDKMDGLDPNFRVGAKRPVSDAEREAMLRKVLRIVKGLSYHELEHILFTPRKGSRPVDVLASKSGTYRYAWNALEDQRIETLFTTMFPPTIGYHEAPVYEWLVDNETGRGKELVLLWGRKYLPDELRATAYADFAAKHGVDTADEVTKIIDAYLTVQYPAHEQRGIELTDKLAELLVNLSRDDIGRPLDEQGLPSLPNSDQQSEPSNPEGDILRKGSPVQKQQKKASEQVAEKIKQEGDKNKRQPAGESDDKSDERLDGSMPGGLAGSTDETTDEQGQSQSDGSPTESSSATDEAGGKGAGGTDVEQTLAEQAESALKGLEADVTLQRDLDAATDLFKRIMGVTDIGGQETRFEEVRPDEDAIRLYKAVGTQLQQLKLELDSERVRRQVAGRVNVRRAMTARPYETDVFDAWDTTGDDVGGVEAVIMVDLSGSMRSRMDDVSKSMWALKRAFDDIDVRVTVLGFASDTSLLYKPEDRVSKANYRKYGARGGTSPWQAFGEAVRILSKSSYPNRVLVAITDGEWEKHPNGSRGEVEVMNVLHSNQVTSLLLGLGPALNLNEVNSAYAFGAFEKGTHGFQIAVAIDSAKSIPKAVSTAVAQVMQRALQENAS